MSERPIIFSGPMISALLAGRKTQTRRILKPRGLYETHPSGELVPIPSFVVGSRLWVREGWAKVGDNDDDIHACPDLRVHAYYRADAVCSEHLRWRSPIFMPRAASRLTLTVSDVRVERLQDISWADALAEGVVDRGRMDGEPYAHCYIPGLPEITMEHDPMAVYSSLWERINGDGAWAANPWVAAVHFTVERRNIDANRPPEPVSADRGGAA